MLENNLFYKRLIIHLDKLVSNKIIEYTLFERVEDIPTSFIPNASGNWTSNSTAFSIPLSNGSIKKIIKEIEIKNKGYPINICIDQTISDFILIYFRNPKIPVKSTGTIMVLTAQLFINGDYILEYKENFDKTFIDFATKFLEEIKFLGNNAVSFIVN